MVSVSMDSRGDANIAVNGILVAWFSAKEGSLHIGELSNGDAAALRELELEIVSDGHSHRIEVDGSGVRDDWANDRDNHNGEG